MSIWSSLRALFASKGAEPEEEDDGDFDPDDPFGGADFPVTEELDLHGLPPKMVGEVVESYLEEARRLGFTLVRVVHGKGIGVQRDRVRAILARTPFVEAFDDAPADRGGWGATVARLRPADPTPGEPPTGT